MNVKQLSKEQIIQIEKFINKTNKQPFISKTLEIESNKLKCAHCPSYNKVKWGIRNGLQRYKCKNCKKTFNSLSNTPLARLRKKEQWIKYAACINKSYTVRKSAKICNVNKNTTFKWRHRFLKSYNFITPKKLIGIIESHNTFFVKPPNGKKYYPIKNINIENKEIIQILYFRDRRNYTLEQIINNQFSLLKERYKHIITKDSLICSNNYSIINKLCKSLNLKHGKLNNEKVKKEIVHINNVSSYITKQNLWFERFRGVGKKYLHNYLSWYRIRDEKNLRLNPILIIKRSRSGDKYQPLTNT